MISGRAVLARTAVCAVILMSGSSTLPAQGLTEGNMEIQAQSLEQISPTASIRLQLANDSEFNLRLGAVAVKALQEAGYIVDERSRMVTLRLETQNVTVAKKSDTSIGSLEAGSGVGVDLNVRLWSSSKNSLLKQNSNEKEKTPAFSITFDAYDEVAGKASWHGEAVTESMDGNNFEAGESMVRQLISAFGTTLKRKTVPLR